ncbi:MAG: hypothetical protein COW79_04570 [Bdellovibrionales bacterium CG22_combo_CG10-13_8_21_14_all_38_13]|nr:MAG: hypothetical protein COW79_04570 [Bdellovibrionales bacterium CG22_combo_CG10-13_8_21_14_all_38_13]
MNRGSYPTLLSSRARLLGGLTRIDLVALALMYLLLAQLKLPSLLSLAINVLFLVVLKIVQRLLARGFWRFLYAGKVLKWHGRLGAICRN